jgi:hypothetical protein
MTNANARPHPGAVCHPNPVLDDDRRRAVVVAIANDDCRPEHAVAAYLDESVCLDVRAVIECTTGAHSQCGAGVCNKPRWHQATEETRPVPDPDSASAFGDYPTRGPHTPPQSAPHQLQPRHRPLANTPRQIAQAEGSAATIHSSLTSLAGLPATMVPAPTRRETTAPSAILAPSWMHTPGKMITRDPITTLSSITTGREGGRLRRSPRTK